MKIDFAALAEKRRIAGMQRQVLIALAGMSLGVQPALAEPTGGTVARGRVSINQNGAQTTVRASQNAVINWRTFNIAAGETTTFIQPSAASVVWNRIADKNPSQIFGNLTANGFVVLFNQSGFYFGPDSVVKVGGLLVSTAPVMMPGDTGGADWTYNGPPPSASIINYGKMETKSGGSLFLVAEKIENHGVLMAPDGTLGLYAGKEVLVSESPDGRGVSAKVTLPEGSVDNTGKLIADAGRIALSAQTVNNGGLIQANSVRERNGVIELVASEAIHLGEQSVLQAKGDAAGLSAGGTISIKTDGQFSDDAGSAIAVSGGAAGGNGGSVEISARQMAAIHSHIDGTAQAGFRGGGLLIDPTDIVFGFNTGENPDALYLDPNGSPSPFSGLAQITYEANRDIFISAFSTWNLNASTGISAPGSMLTLEAGRNIVFGDSARIVGGSGWSVSLSAGSGGIYLNGGPDINGTRQSGSGSIETLDGAISLRAGTDVLLGGGFVRTMQGGNIDIVAGRDVDAGIKTDGYQFNRFGPLLSVNGLGGIATGRGGNVAIHAGNDIVTGPSSIGAYAEGNVTLDAGRNVQGRFLVHAGMGSIKAGYDFGSSGSPGSLALSSGGWRVEARHDVYLNEVYNPNGSQNSSPGQFKFKFDYAEDASVFIDGGNAVHLLGNNPLRTSANPDRLPIYAPQLTVVGGAGGIELGNDLILAPSSRGSLSLVTMDGGSLRSTPGNSYQIVMSDSGSPDYRTFASGHAQTPLHVNQNNAVTAEISGNIENVLLQVPLKAMIHVGGDTLNFSFEGQNLAADETTSIVVDGDITSRGNRTSVMGVTPNLIVLNPRYTTAENGLENKLVYDAKTHTLSFVGRMTEIERDFLLHPLIKQYDALGNLIIDAQGFPVLVPAQFVDAAAVLALYENSQDIPSSPNAFRGFQLGGPGNFVVSARDVDLGITSGIRSQGTLLNQALSGISPKGADIFLTVHDLEMGASQIASFSRGSIDVESSGHINVGSQLNFTSDDTPKGIFTSSGGDVTVTAENGINVNGSRIATYDGGNITVIAHHGDVDAGAGGLGSVSVFRTIVDPVTGQVTINSTTVPGSGILATTLPRTDSRIGNITVHAEDGSVIASAGGVLQLSFNQVQENASATIDISARGHKSYPDEGIVGDPSKGNIAANNSGIIGGNVKLEADGDITGLVVARQDINIRSEANVSVTALAQGTASVGGANISGSTIVGGVGVSVSAASIQNSSLVSASVSASGSQSGVQAGVGTSAAATVNAKQAEDADKTVAAKTTDDDDDEKKKKKKQPIHLARTVGRVTVILPEKSK